MSKKKIQKPELFPENRLREMRKLRGYDSPLEFGKLVGLSAIQVNRIEARTRRFTTAVQHACAKVLRCNIQDLIVLPIKDAEVRPDIDPFTMRLAISVIQNACENQDVNLSSDIMAELVTELYGEIVTINLDIRQAQLKAESLVSKAKVSL